MGFSLLLKPLRTDATSLVIHFNYRFWKVQGETARLFYESSPLGWLRWRLVASPRIEQHCRLFIEQHSHYTPIRSALRGISCMIGGEDHPHLKLHRDVYMDGVMLQQTSEGCMQPTLERCTAMRVVACRTVRYCR